MIITCPCNKKKFKIDSSLIPIEGRKLKCGSCEKVWFYRIPQSTKLELSDNQTNDEITENLSNENEKSYVQNNKYQKNSGGILFKIFGYFIVITITLVAIIIILDTFQLPLSNIFPNLELILFNLFETLKDIKFFIKDLIS